MMFSKKNDVAEALQELVDKTCALTRSDPLGWITFGIWDRYEESSDDEEGSASEPGKVHFGCNECLEIDHRLTALEYGKAAAIVNKELLICAADADATKATITVTLYPCGNLVYNKHGILLDEGEHGDRYIEHPLPLTAEQKTQCKDAFNYVLIESLRRLLDKVDA